MAILLLCCFAFVAGFVDAMVGGGGLIQLPAMFILQPQLALTQILATNKTASFLGTAVSTVKYMKRVKLNWAFLLPAIASAFAGAFGGALLVSFVRKEQFMPFIIGALLLVLLYTIFKKELGLRRIETQLSSTQYYLRAIATGLIIGFYDGLIGPGTGSFLIFAFVILFGYDFLQASANGKVINCVTNIAALSFFLMQGSILWAVALPVGLANMLGSYTGAQLALKKGSRFVRIFFIVVVTVLILKLGYDYFFP